MFAFFAGLAAGLLHVFSGPDHLAAVAPLAADTGRGQWKTGLQWGVGHTIGVLPLEIISANSERLVGVALILVGAWGVWKASRTGFTPHGHSHLGASFGMGALHGLAGSSHLFGVLPALAFATRSDAGLYLAGFGAGAIIGMTSFSAAMGLLSSKLSHRHSSGLLYASSAAALVIGGFWLVGH
jgi:hypothetical protein